MEDTTGYIIHYKTFLLPFTVMSFDINFSTVNHSEVASDIRKFVSSILAIIAKALKYAFVCVNINYYHSFQISVLRAKSGFLRLHHPLNKKQGLNYSKILTL